MALSRRLRFEILRRDNHTCRYCGSSAPDVKLTVDHVVPVTLGGTDDPANLVTACPECNSGKSSVPADAALVDEVAQDALRWRRAMEAAAAVLDKEYAEREAVLTAWREQWDSWSYETMERYLMDDGRRGVRPVEKTVELPPDWSGKVWDLYRAGLPLRDLRGAADVALGKRNVRDEFIGVARQKLSVRQSVAREMLDRGLV